MKFVRYMIPRRNWAHISKKRVANGSIHYTLCCVSSNMLADMCISDARSERERGGAYPRRIVLFCDVIRYNILRTPKDVYFEDQIFTKHLLGKKHLTSHNQ